MVFWGTVYHEKNKGHPSKFSPRSDHLMLRDIMEEPRSYIILPVLVCWGLCKHTDMFTCLCSRQNNQKKTLYKKSENQKKTLYKHVFHEGVAWNKHLLRMTWKKVCKMAPEQASSKMSLRPRRCFAIVHSIMFSKTTNTSCQL